MESAAKSKISFPGVFRRQLDEKNRFTIPSDWRGKGEVKEVYLVPKGGECLLVLTVEEFGRVTAKGEKLEETEPIEAAKFLRHFHAAARRGAPDGHGRLVLPEDFCEKFTLGDGIALVGGSGRFEIWNLARWDRTAEVEQPEYQPVARRMGV
ncbi:MAG: hypothetical protein H0X40_13855 [Chthoniobacterales bacterium]|nr:hypothetical protein [Chthoniobacterales bacterium]